MTCCCSSVYARRPGLQSKERWSAAAASRFQGSDGTIGVNGRLPRELITEDFQAVLIRLCLNPRLHLRNTRHRRGFTANGAVCMNVRENRKNPTSGIDGDSVSLSGIN